MVDIPAGVDGITYPVLIMQEPLPPISMQFPRSLAFIPRAQFPMAPRLQPLRAA
jgi:hypothetical protein